MHERQVGNRRAILKLIGSALAAAAASLFVPARLSAEGRRELPEPLRAIASPETCRHARRLVQVRPCEPAAVTVGLAYLRAPGNEAAREACAGQTRRDMVAGRVAVVRGWVVADTELALLSMVER